MRNIGLHLLIKKLLSKYFIQYNQAKQSELTRVDFLHLDSNMKLEWVGFEQGSHKLVCETLGYICWPGSNYLKIVFNTIKQSNLNLQGSIFYTWAAIWNSSGSGLSKGHICLYAKHWVTSADQGGHQPTPLPLGHVIFFRVFWCVCGGVLDQI